MRTVGASVVAQQVKCVQESYRRWPKCSGLYPDGKPGWNSKLLASTPLHLFAAMWGMDQQIEDACVFMSLYHSALLIDKSKKKREEERREEKMYTVKKISIDFKLCFHQNEFIFQHVP